MSSSDRNQHGIGVGLSAQDHITHLSGALHIPRAEKDADDPSHPPMASPTTENQHNTTFTTLTRLLGATSLSPEASRTSSYMVPEFNQGYTRNTDLAETMPLPEHLYTRGLLQGRHSDITVQAFGTAYKLHRLILDRAPFFATALSGPWLEARSSEITVRPDDIDGNITKRGFELALKHLYGGTSHTDEDDEYAIELFATGCWLEMPELVESTIESILRQMTLETLGKTISLLTTNYYGRSGDKILASAKAMLCRDGWRMPIKHWDNIPADIVKEIVSSDGFFVMGEWERYTLAVQILNRRLRAKVRDQRVQLPTSRSRIGPAVRSRARDDDSGMLTDIIEVYSSPEIVPLLALIDSGVHYVHLEFEQLQHIRESLDVLGYSLLPEHIITDALWQQTLLRQRVLNSQESDLELGFASTQFEQSPIDEDVSRPTAPRRRGAADVHNTVGSQQLGRPQEESASLNISPRYLVPSNDCNVVVGGISDPAMPSVNHSAYEENHPWPPPLATANVDSSKGKATDKIIANLYSSMPPFRFSAEFPSPKALKEKKRVYSRTIFYAGSMWNIYIQKVASSGRGTKQLGVYLHRAKEQLSEEGVCLSSNVRSLHTSAAAGENRIGLLEQEMYRQPQRRRQNGSQALWDEEESFADADTPINARRTTSGWSRQLAPDSLGPETSADSTMITFTTASDGEHDSLEEDDDHLESTSVFKRNRLVPALPPYTDTRATIKTYFKIYSPSRGGRMLSVYESAPDKFNFSQSWGWKSSTLMLDEGMVSPDENEQVSKGAGGRDAGDGVTDGNYSATSIKTEGARRTKAKSLDDGKLRFMVVIGVI